jgi:hypothetical protein
MLFGRSITFSLNSIFLTSLIFRPRSSFISVHITFLYNDIIIYYPPIRVGGGDHYWLHSTLTSLLLLHIYALMIYIPYASAFYVWPASRPTTALPRLYLAK